MNKDLVPQTALDTSTLESVLIGGDLARLTPAQRVSYYTAVCNSIGLNPLTKPFDYITLKGKLTLYALKGATDQLRDNHNISIGKPDIRFEDDWIIVTVEARDSNNRMDSDIGVVNRKDMQGDFGNALMKAVTKAKRRVTLSICGLGLMDETEVETIKGAEKTKVNEDGEILDVEPVKVVTEQLPVQPLPEEPPAILEEAAALGAVVGEVDPLSWAKNAMAPTKSGELMRMGDMTREQLEKVTTSKAFTKDIQLAAKALLAG